MGVMSPMPFGDQRRQQKSSMPMTNPASPGTKLRNHIRYCTASTFFIAGTRRPDPMTISRRSSARARISSGACE